MRGHGIVRAVDLVIVISWIAFWAYWLIEAGRAKPQQGRRSRYAGCRIAIVVVIVFLLRALGFRSHPSGSDAVLTGAGLALFFAGLALAVWARRYLGRNWGVPMSRKDEPELVTTGPYRRVRHPIYTGLILAMLGTALVTTLSWDAQANADLAGGRAHISRDRFERREVEQPRRGA